MDSPPPPTEQRLVQVGVQQDHVRGPNPRLALALAVAVGILVFVVFLAVRRTFGVKR